MSGASRTRRSRCARARSGIGYLGWRDILWRTWRGTNDDSLLMVARSIAFSGVMALLPSLAAFISLYGLFADPLTARDHLALLTGVLPADALTLLGEEVIRIATEAQASLSLTFLLGLVVAFWAANTGMRALIRGLNIAYGEHERRSFVRLTRTSATMTLAAFAFLLTAAGALVVVPLLLRLLRAPVELLPLGELRWPALLALAVIAFELVYRFGPNRPRARWCWLSWGSAIAAAAWLLGSLALSTYIAGFAGFNATYGSLGAIFGFLTWSWISAVVILLGAKLNAEIERQTRRDTTRSSDRPMGRVGGGAANTVGQSLSAPRPRRTLSRPSERPGHD